jgi:hypothetical protein
MGVKRAGVDDRSKEKWFPSSVDFMLAKYGHVRPTKLLLK